VVDFSDGVFRIVDRKGKNAACNERREKNERGPKRWKDKVRR
jgi:hypothetical protein